MTNNDDDDNNENDIYETVLGFFTLNILFYLTFLYFLK
jgi:hypothetical protein